MSLVRSVVLGCGTYLPSRVLSNDDLARMVDTTDDWIVQRTGIRQRHIAAAGEVTSDLALHAAKAALADAGVDAQSIDLIVLGTHGRGAVAHGKERHVQAADTPSPPTAHAAGQPSGHGPSARPH